MQYPVRDQPTSTTVFIGGQLVPIITRALVRACRVGAGMCTSTIVAGTLVDV